MTATLPAPTTDVIARAVGLTKTYGTGDAQVHALAGVDLELRRGSFTAIMGPSGSGKSTAMNTIGLLDRPSSGRFLFNGVEVQGLDRDSRALLRRGVTEASPSESLIRIETDSRRVYLRGEEVQLTSKEFDLLRVLVRNEGKVVSRERLMRDVWDTAWFGSTKTLDVHISALRRRSSSITAKRTASRRLRSCLNASTLS